MTRSQPSSLVILALGLVLAIAFLSPSAESKKGRTNERGTNHRNHHRPHLPQAPGGGGVGEEECHTCDEHDRRMKKFQCLPEYPHFLGGDFRLVVGG